MNLLKIIFLFFCTWMTGELTAQTPFERYFLDKTLRFDYYHCGDSRNQEYFFDELKEEPYWAGSKVSLLDDTGYGVQLFKIFDKASGKEIYSRSYCTLFNEWQTTPEAQTVRKAMPEFSLTRKMRYGSRSMPVTGKEFLKRNSNRTSIPILIL